MRPLLRIGSCLVALIAPAWAQSNPLNTPVAEGEGGTLFQTHCSYCHGAKGEGGRGPDLTTGLYRRGGTDDILFSTIRNGIPGTEMPVVRATDDEVSKMVAFVKRLGSAGLNEKAPGDAAAGKALYGGKGKCAACHSLGRDGGSLGPDLSDVGRRRRLAYLEESLVRPEADVPIRYRALQVITKAGETITGIRLNEDDISLQLRDEKDDLRAFLKSNLRQIIYDKPALMPPFGSTLSTKEIEDLVAYLSSLRGLQ